jgi:Pyruvate/2-oxoacid:ferredoxin oxidoreductase delta subunit
MFLDRQIIYKNLGKLSYKLTISTGLVRSPLVKKFENLIRKHPDKFVHPDDAAFCFPKAGVIEIKESVKKQDMVLPFEVVDHFIDESCYRAIMNFCICRDSNKCKDYPIDFGCMFMGEAAKSIHPDLCRSVTKEEARAHVRKSQELGLVILAGRHVLDSTWLGVSPNTQLFSVCLCCPCCCGSLIFPYLSSDLTDWVYKMPGVSVQVGDECVGCGDCVDACIYGGIVVKDDLAVITEHCRACGRCAEACPHTAITMQIDDPDYIKKAIEFLEPRVDVT